MGFIRCRAFLIVSNGEPWLICHITIVNNPLVFTGGGGNWFRQWMKQVTMPVAWPPARMASLGNDRWGHRLGDRTSGSRRSKNEGWLSLV